MSTRKMGIEEARAKLGDLVLDAQQHGITTAITRNGRRAAVLARDAETTRASHDLNDVTELRILGWTGRHVVAVHEDDSRWARIEAPMRHEGDIWTFSQQRAGVLKCHTGLLGSPSLLTPTDTTMTVYLPADLVGVVEVTFADEASGEQR